MIISCIPDAADVRPARNGALWAARGKARAAWSDAKNAQAAKRLQLRLNMQAGMAGRPGLADFRQPIGLYELFWKSEKLRRQTHPNR